MRQDDLVCSTAVRQAVLEKAPSISKLTISSKGAREAAEKKREKGKKKMTEPLAPFARMRHDRKGPSTNTTEERTLVLRRGIAGMVGPAMERLQVPCLDATHLFVQYVRTVVERDTVS